MIQRHSLILWKKNKDNNIDKIIEEVFYTMEIFNTYDKRFRPNYLTVNQKKDIEEFDWNLDNFTATLRNCVNKEGNTTFEDLGYNISFYSMKDESESVSFSLDVGNQNGKFYDSLVVGFPIAVNFYDESIYKMIEGLFEKVVTSYKPYWGCMLNKVNARKYDQFMQNEIPTTIHWLNYWSQGLMNKIGLEKIDEVTKVFKECTFANGILHLKNNPLDVNNEDDMMLQEKINKFLDL